MKFLRLSRDGVAAQLSQMKKRLRVGESMEAYLIPDGSVYDLPPIGRLAYVETRVYWSTNCHDLARDIIQQLKEKLK